MSFGTDPPPILESNRGVLDLRPLDELSARAQEVVTVIDRVERHDVGTEHAVEHLCPPRQPAEHLGGRERYMEEEPDPARDLALSKQAREQEEMVVVHPPEAVVSGSVGRGEPRVHLSVGSPPGALERGLLHEPVEQRPERAVRESVVIGIDITPGERHRAQLDVEALHAAGHLGTTVPPDP